MGRIVAMGLLVSWLVTSLSEAIASQRCFIQEEEDRPSGQMQALKSRICRTLAGSRGRRSSPSSHRNSRSWSSTGLQGRWCQTERWDHIARSWNSNRRTQAGSQYRSSCLQSHSSRRKSSMGRRSGRWHRTYNPCWRHRTPGRRSYPVLPSAEAHQCLLGWMRGEPWPTR